MSEPLSFFLFFLVFVPFTLIYYQRTRKAHKEMLALLRETNRLLSEIATKKDQ
jgi:hypothetical protein